MKLIKNYWMILFCFCLLSCNKREHDIVVPFNEPTNIDEPSDAPRVYFFLRHGKSTVRNVGQTVRHLLVQDAKILMERLSQPGAEPITFEKLYKYYDNNQTTINGNILTETQLPPLQPNYTYIAGGRDLKAKVLDEYVDEITNNMTSWFQTISDNSNDPSKLGTDMVLIEEETGYDLSEFFQKTAYGAVLFSHALHSYFRNVEDKNNEDLFCYPGWLTSYTEMEHHMDEVFGYYGASRVFHDYTIEEIADIEGHQNYKDGYIPDEKIDFNTEYNFSFVVEAARRDLASKTATNYAETIFEAFRLARVAIVEKNYEELIFQKEIILSNWEEVIAASTIHHLNALLVEMDQLSNNSNHHPFLMYKHWSAMYKYIEVLRYNYNNRLVNWEDLQQAYMRTPEVPFPKALSDDPSKIVDFKLRIEAVRSIVQATYNFAEEDVLAW